MCDLEERANALGNYLFKWVKCNTKFFFEKKVKIAILSNKCDLKVIDQ